MVQNVGAQNSNPYGSINRIGTTNNGRVVYQVIGADGKEAGKMSVSQKDCDTFEKSYRDILESAPKLQRYAETTTPEQMQKKQTTAKWIVAGAGILGGVIPLFKAKGEGWLGLTKQVLFTIGGTVAGLLAGTFIASKTVTPPGATEFAKATEKISKMDIQPVID